ncbi:Hpt domain-containing protein [Alteromonas sp. KUL49]|uniref:Hpt domain-containing protein n=1 Tax=Alteromonas sp. KUL49 TaxID=2480798 RepID=UPI00102F05DC|nr:Hpt domain-containing protein [Alteromonas sp. KUL49]TAP41388.1 Hpt domain-containing protein [Alteromonas sp. KUL49]GEA10461.1 hypothetical protein KUL49_08360 [Alteromonas sp. KUL49]
MDKSVTVLDFDFGMSQLSGNKALLLTLLNKFLEEYRSLSDDLKQLMADNDFDKAYSLVHTLKGVTGNLGLFALHSKSKEVETSIRGDKTLPDDYVAFEALLNETISAIEALSNEAPAKDTEVTDNALAKQARDQLTRALKANEFISQSKLDDWMDALGFNADVRQAIEDAVDELDYEEAIATLEQA